MSKAVVRVTQLEKFRRYMYGTSEYDTEQSVVDTLTGTFAGNEMTRIGTAFHSIVDLDHIGRYEYLDIGDYCFDIEGHNVYMDASQVQTALQYRGEFPGAFHETRCFKDYGDAVVTGCADLIYGLEVRDIKTKYSPVSDSDYIDSCQWRFYLELFRADVFHFDLFQFHGYRREVNGHDVRGLPLTRQTPPITCYRYDGMESDNARLLADFMDFARRRGLIEYLTWKER